MRGRELPLVLLVLVLCQAPQGPAVPMPAGGGTVLTKMYPRGNHWAVALSFESISDPWSSSVGGLNYDSCGLKSKLRPYAPQSHRCGD
ncbi:hypothetical protein P7K49_028034 [Saguinus oedipus]|uniref:Neuromedin-C n=1 Tax=Saguinus oedipus TaxID=9490 RepID=A0ABQ9UBL9_SAGOE|nr:hypothetical protein P7K49_028034 [Saguinus oedipus]